MQVKLTLKILFWQVCMVESVLCSKDGAFSFANKVPGVFENAKNAEGFVKITELKPSHRTRVAASICEECKTVIFKY